VTASDQNAATEPILLRAERSRNLDTVLLIVFVAGVAFLLLWLVGQAFAADPMAGT
jgi:hypothetical protein